MESKWRAHHVPEEGGEPVEGGAHAADGLHVALLGDALVGEVDHEGAGDEAESQQHHHGNAHVCRARLTGNRNIMHTLYTIGIWGARVGVGGSHYLHEQSLTITLSS